MLVFAAGEAPRKERQFVASRMFSDLQKERLVVQRSFTLKLA